jgi:hypothetical protein
VIAGMIVIEVLRSRRHAGSETPISASTAAARAQSAKNPAAVSS